MKRTFNIIKGTFKMFGLTKNIPRL